jgi:hypothetical protein
MFALVEGKPAPSRHAKDLLESLCSYFTEQRVCEELVPFMTEKSVSGRMCDYLVTTYSKKRYCPVGTSTLDIRHLYEMSLREAGGRCLFDPFNRISSGLVVQFQCPVSNILRKTTVAQMNFVRWYFSNGVNGFVARNQKAISQDMRVTYQRIKSEKVALAGKKRKRQSLAGFPVGRGTIMLAKRTIILMSSD